MHNNNLALSGRFAEEVPFIGTNQTAAFIRPLEIISGLLADESITDITITSKRESYETERGTQTRTWDAYDVTLLVLRHEEIHEVKAGLMYLFIPSILATLCNAFFTIPVDQRVAEHLQNIKGKAYWEEALGHIALSSLENEISYLHVGRVNAFQDLQIRAEVAKHNVLVSGSAL